MYQVGTNAGNANTERQGTGYATTLETPMVNGIITTQVQEAARQRAEQLKRMEATKKVMTDFNPDNWLRHDAEVQGMIQEHLRDGGSIVAAGVNPYDATDKRSLDYQSKEKRIKAYASASMQMKDEFEKLQGAYTNNTNSFRDKILNWDELAEFYSNPSVKDVVDNNKIAPVPIFKSPMTDTQGVTTKIIEGWEKTSGETVMSWSSAADLARATIENPAMSEGVGDGYIGVQRQLYNQLTPEDKESMTNRGARLGLDGLGMFIANDFFNKRSANVSLADIAAKVAIDAPKSKSTNEIDDVTKSFTGYTGGNAALKASLRSKFTVVRGQIDREVDAGKYGSPDKSAEQNLESAVSFYFNEITKKNLATESLRALDEKNAGGGDEDVNAGFDRWWKALNNGSYYEKANAMRYIDPEVVWDLIPGGQKKSAVPGGRDEAISSIDSNPMGDLVVKTNKREFAISRLDKEEAFKNAYAKTFKKVNRNYGTTEAGTDTGSAKAPAAPSMIGVLNN